MTHPSGTGYERDLYTIEGLPPETSQVLERRFMKAVDQSASDTVERLLEHRFEAEARLGSLPSHLMRVLLKCELSVRFLTNRPVTPNWAMSDTIATNDGTQIYYKNWGAGQPVVFSRGWPLSADA
jgi:hypothetical protein